MSRNPTIHSQEFDKDSKAAYQCAVMWCVTKDKSFAQVTIEILNGWAGRLQRITGADAVLCAGLGPFKMINAAELVRYTESGWTENEAVDFGAMLRRAVLPVIENFAPFANGNWDTAALKTMMAAGIYLDDRALFERALIYYRFGCGDGRLEHYIYPGGQCQESGRDQQHTQLGLAHMGDCCEMAWHQGLDLYGCQENRLLAGFEYTAQYELGEEVPFVADVDQTGKYRHERIAERSPLRAVWEQIYHHYVRRRGLSAPWTERAAAKVRPEGPGFGADHTGFGTLLYSREAGPDTAESAGVGAPAGLVVRWQEHAMLLDFVPLATGQAVVVSRAEGSGTFRTLDRAVRGSGYRDSSAQVGHRYRYRVGTAIADEWAGLPEGWAVRSVGTLTGSAGAGFDGARYRLVAGSGDAGAYVVVGRGLAGDGVLTARLVPLIASQFLEVGLGVLGERGMVVLSMSPHGQAERPGWTVRLGGDGVGLEAPTVTYGRLVKAVWLRLERRKGMMKGMISEDGTIWKEVGSVVAPRGHTEWGMVLNSRVEGVTTEVEFDQVSVAAL
jgi:hypothetical protein